MLHQILVSLLVIAGMLFLSVMIRSLFTAIIGMLPRGGDVDEVRDFIRQIDALPLELARNIAIEAITNRQGIATTPRRSQPSDLEAALPPMIRTLLNEYEELDIGHETGRIGVAYLRRLNDRSIVIGWCEDSGDLFVRDGKEEILATQGGNVDGEWFAPSVFHALLLLSGNDIRRNT